MNKLKTDRTPPADGHSNDATSGRQQPPEGTGSNRGRMQPARFGLDRHRRLLAVGAVEACSQLQVSNFQGRGQGLKAEG